MLRSGAGLERYCDGIAQHSYDRFTPPASVSAKPHAATIAPRSALASGFDTSKQLILTARTQFSGRTRPIRGHAGSKSRTRAKRKRRAASAVRPDAPRTLLGPCSKPRSVHTSVAARAGVTRAPFKSAPRARADKRARAKKGGAAIDAPQRQ